MNFPSSGERTMSLNAWQTVNENAMETEHHLEGLVKIVLRETWATPDVAMAVRYSEKTRLA